MSPFTKKPSAEEKGASVASRLRFTRTICRDLRERAVAGLSRAAINTSWRQLHGKRACETERHTRGKTKNKRSSMWKRTFTIADHHHTSNNSDHRTVNLALAWKTKWWLYNYIFNPNYNLINYTSLGFILYGVSFMVVSFEGFLLKWNQFVF